MYITPLKQTFLSGTATLYRSGDELASQVSQTLDFLLDKERYNKQECNIIRRVIFDQINYSFILSYTGCSLNFPSNFVIFLNSASSAAALVLYLPGVCTQTDT